MVDHVIETGTVIAIPVEDGRFALAQVYRPGVVFYLLIFRIIQDGNYSEEDLSKPAVLGAWTTDGELHRGSWTVLGKSPVRVSGFKEPEYKVVVSGKNLVESFDGKSRRPFDESSDRELRNRSSQSSPLVEAAARAYFGYEEWKPLYNKLLVCDARQPEKSA